MKLKLTILSVFFWSLNSNAWADNGMLAQMKSMMEEMQKQMAEMQRTIQEQNVKIDALEHRKPQIEMSESGEVDIEQEAFDKMLEAKIGESHKWLKDLKFSGDLRLRYEAFDFTSGNPSETDSRNRFRYRLRFGFDKKLTDEFTAGFSLASGEASNGQNVDPTSTNTTLDNNFNLKDIFIDRAYASYSPKLLQVGPIEKVTIAGGKVANPFEKGSSEMIWDRDVRPEGAYEKIDVQMIDHEDLKVKGYGLAGQFILDEDASASDHADSELYAWQAGLDTKLMTPFFEKPASWLSAFSYYNYSDYAENSNFLIGTTSLARGNSNFEGAATELDADEFDVIEFYNEVTLFPLFDVPIKPFVDVAHNVAANVTTQDDETWAWAFGAKIGEAKKKGEWEIGYAYKRIEANSVVGAFNDADFGSGNSNKRGSQFKLAYALTDNIQLNGAAFFVNSLATGTGGVLDEETRRFQADMNWKFG
jgi:hypothetical protein